MLEQFVKDASTIQSMRSDPVGSYIDSFISSLLDLGYARSTVKELLCFLSDFNCWLGYYEVKAADIDDQIISTFEDYLRRQGRLRQGKMSTIRRYVDYLRGEGAIPPAKPGAEQPSPIANLICRYEIYMRKERGLTTATVDNYRPFVHRLLVDCFGDGVLRLRELEPSNISGFILRHAHSMSPGRAKLMVTAFRSFFRFLLQHGEIEVDLAATVPTVADWRLATVPRYIAIEDVERMLAGCDRGTATGRRDYAILLLLSRLGLRAGEIVALELDDIDWRAGEITVPGKGLRRDRLPLLADVGEALADYLRRGRPQCKARQVFVCMKAPLRGFANSAAVTTIVRRALDRVGLQPPFKGAYLLRHSLATGMLRRGASMREIGEVLRHRVPNTTEIYAKVDFEGLRALALPWPGSGGVR